MGSARGSLPHRTEKHLGSQSHCHECRIHLHHFRKILATLSSLISGICDLECSLIKHIYIIHFQMMPRNISLIYFCSIHTKRNLHNVILYTIVNQKAIVTLFILHSLCVSHSQMAHHGAPWCVRGCTIRWRSPPPRRIVVNRRSESLLQLGNNNLFSQLRKRFLKKWPHSRKSSRWVNALLL